MVIVCPLLSTVIKKAVVLAEGMVENVNIEPPLTNEGMIAEEDDDDAVKSPDKPVVAPSLPDTNMVHVMATLALGGDPVTQLRRDAVVGFP